MRLPNHETQHCQPLSRAAVTLLLLVGSSSGKALGACGLTLELPARAA